VVWAARGGKGEKRKEERRRGKEGKLSCRATQHLFHSVGIIRRRGRREGKEVSKTSFPYAQARRYSERREEEKGEEKLVPFLLLSYDTLRLNRTKGGGGGGEKEKSPVDWGSHLSSHFLGGIRGKGRKEGIVTFRWDPSFSAIFFLGEEKEEGKRNHKFLPLVNYSNAR